MERRRSQASWRIHNATSCLRPPSRCRRVFPWPVKWWIAFWHWYVIILPLGITVVTTVWFSIGAGLDLRQLFRDLRVLKRDEHDDGTVKNHRNLDEIKDGGK
ncbi:MAG: hypothetical protein WCP55_25605 [Lentisphaerota bacterium]